MNGSLTWFWLSLFFAISTSIGTSIDKRIISRMNVLLFILIGQTFNALFIFLIVYFTVGIPNISIKLFEFILIAAILDSIAAVFSFYAIKISPISLISPISSFNPVFTAIIATLTLHEVLNPIKSLGILIVVIGAYLLNVSEIRGGLFLPFKKLFVNKGVLFFLLANLIWAITPIFQKQAVFQTKPAFPLSASLFENLIIIAIFIPIALTRTKDKIRQFKTNWKILLILGPWSAASSWAAFTAFSLAPLGLVTSVFKLSTFFTILFGFYFFKEERIWERLLGASVMIAGTILLLK